MRTEKIENVVGRIKGAATLQNRTHDYISPKYCYPNPDHTSEHFREQGFEVYGFLIRADVFAPPITEIIQVGPIPLRYDYYPFRKSIISPDYSDGGFGALAVVDSQQEYDDFLKALFEDDFLRNLVEGEKLYYSYFVLRKVDLDPEKEHEGKIVAFRTTGQRSRTMKLMAIDRVPFVSLTRKEINSVVGGLAGHDYSPCKTKLQAEAAIISCGGLRLVIDNR